MKCEHIKIKRTIASRPIAFRGIFKGHLFKITGCNPTGQSLNEQVINKLVKDLQLNNSYSNAFYAMHFHNLLTLFFNIDLIAVAAMLEILLVTTKII